MQANLNFLNKIYAINLQPSLSRYIFSKYKFVGIWYKMLLTMADIVY